MSFNDIFETTWGGDDDLRSFAQVELLLFNGTLMKNASMSTQVDIRFAKSTYSSYDGHTFETEWRCKLASFTLDLLRQFTRRREDESIGTEMPVIFSEWWQLLDECKHWNDERGSFTGTCTLVSDTPTASIA